MRRYNVGDTVYFIEGKYNVVKAEVILVGWLYSLRYKSTMSSGMAGIRLNASRLYATEEEARAAIDISQGPKRVTGDRHPR